jgi:tetratricopeptide (TPR) repeat protein
MTKTRTFKQKLAQVNNLWANKQYDKALAQVEALLQAWPGNAPLYILWASLVQLQEHPAHTLEEVKETLEKAVDFDKTSPAGHIELGHYLDAVGDNPQAASRAFSEGIRLARQFLVDGLLGQAKALLQLNKRREAIRCLIEALSLSNFADTSRKGKAAEVKPAVRLRGPSAPILEFQLQGPFAQKIESLLQDVLASKSA